jgi:hypothetical protein
VHRKATCHVRSSPLLRWPGWLTRRPGLGFSRRGTAFALPHASRCTALGLSSCWWTLLASISSPPTKYIAESYAQPLVPPLRGSFLIHTLFAPISPLFPQPSQRGNTLVGRRIRSRAERQDVTHDRTPAAREIRIRLQGRGEVVGVRASGRGCG